MPTVREIFVREILYIGMYFCCNSWWRWSLLFPLPIQYSRWATNKAGCLICWVTAIQKGVLTAYYFSKKVYSEEYVTIFSLSLHFKMEKKIETLTFPQDRCLQFMHASNSWEFCKNYNMNIKYFIRKVLLTEEGETFLTLNQLCYLLPIQLCVWMPVHPPEWCCWNYTQWWA